MIELERVRGVIFHLDGTLLDSMHMWREIDKAYLVRHGQTLPEDLQQCIAGLSVTDTARFFKQRFGLADSTDEIIADWNAMAREEYLYHLPLKPGAEALVRSFAGRGFKLGIATTNYRNLTEGCLARHGLLDLFSAVVTSADICRGKPDPEIFLKAAELMGIAPEACLVFEDMPEGILAGKRAGMQTVAIYDAASQTRDEEKRSLADDYAESPEAWQKNNLITAIRISEEENVNL